MAASDYPEISPTHFSLIVSGTSLSSSLLAAAAASASKSVLHVDPNSFYGSHSSTLSPTLFHDFLHLPQPLSEPSNKLLLDISAPKLLYCADSMVDILIRSGGSNHVEFKGVDSSLFYDDGKLCNVPDSRQAIFKDKSLSLAEKREMMKFLKVVQGHFGDGVNKVEEEDLGLPFVEFLKKQGLPSRITSIILYAIVMADWDQESKEECKKVITTKEGLESIALYSKSVARFQNAAGAFIYPMYGLGELPQAFCRIAAVKGALYVLRMPVNNILFDEETKNYRGVKLASGQEIYSEHLIMEPSSINPSSALSSSNSDESKASKVTEIVVRGVCVTSSSVHQGLSNVLVIFPPKSLHSDQFATVRALQLSSNVAVCPPGQFVVYLSTPCNDASTGKEYIRAAMNALFSYTIPNNSEGVPSNDGVEEAHKPNLLWSSIYVQDITQASFDTFYMPPSSDASLDYRDMLESTMKLFKQIYPEEEFLPQIPVSEDNEDDNDSSE